MKSSKVPKESNVKIGGKFGTKPSAKLTWMNDLTVTSAKKMIDMGQILSWGNGRQAAKVLGVSGCEEVVRYVAVRLGDRYEDRLASEILVETLYAILTSVESESVMIAFLEGLFDSEEFENITRQLVDISLGGEVGESDIEKAVVTIAVSLICEIGLNIYRIEEDHPGQIAKSKALTEHIATYLLSVSNTNVQTVRICLLRYFSQTEYGKTVKSNYSRVMNRFGHTIYEALFQQLFVKKSEKIASQFLLENLPCGLEDTNRDTQAIVHEMLKQYMFKESERFCLFIHQLGAHLIAISQEGTLCLAAENFSRHLVSLYVVTAELGHRELAKEVLQELHRFGPYGECSDWIRALESAPSINRLFREMVSDYRKTVVERGRLHKVTSQFRKSKRGRKPTITKGDFGFLEQVRVLGEYEVRHSAA
jgi:hypothetical protein